MTTGGNEGLDEIVNKFLKTLPNQEPYPKIHYRETQGGLNNMASSSVLVEYLVPEEDSSENQGLGE